MMAIGPVFGEHRSPGVDDPLVGVNKVGTVYTKYYYVTDGGGRQLAFTDGAGANYDDQPVYTNNGGNQAGGIASASGFDNARSGTQEAPKLSFYRNRYYDQQTGRWTQEDPIGIAGGVNLYQYAGNNPATFTDPFGLCPEEMRNKHPDCDEWNGNQLEKAKQVTSDEIARGNPSAKASTIPIAPVNDDEIQKRCQSTDTNTGCTIKQGDTPVIIIVNVDRNPAAISGTLRHEQYHVDNPAERRDACAQRAAFQYVTHMSSAHQQAARSGNRPEPSFISGSTRGCK